MLADLYSDPTIDIPTLLLTFTKCNIVKPHGEVDQAIEKKF